MLFKQKHLAAIKSGKISLAFRKWKILSVKPNEIFKTEIGRMKIGSIQKIQLEDITNENAQKAGFTSDEALKKLLSEQKEGTIYEIEVSYLDDQKVVIVNEHGKLDQAEYLAIKEDLEMLDKKSKIGKWTRKTMQLIAENPHMKAADLAKLARKEKEWLKVNVRKLKSLGLTESHEPGYSLTVLGFRYLNSIG